MQTPNSNKYSTGKCWPWHLSRFCRGPSILPTNAQHHLPERSGRACGPIYQSKLERLKTSVFNRDHPFCRRTHPWRLTGLKSVSMRTQICLYPLSISLCSFRVSWLDSIGSRITIISKIQFLSVGLDQERGIPVSDGSHETAVGSFQRVSCCYSAALTDLLLQLVQYKSLILNCITLQCSICTCVLMHHAAAFVLPVFHHFWLRDGPILVSNDVASANHPCVHWVVAAWYRWGGRHQRFPGWETCLGHHARAAGPLSKSKLPLCCLLNLNK